MIKVSSILRMLRSLNPDPSKAIPFKYRELQGKTTG
jgi:hypothetical protein